MDRKSLRKKVVEVLKKSELDGIGQDIFSGRSIPTDHSNLPVILVYSRSEDAARFDEAPKSYMRNLSISLEIITTDDTDELLSDQMDDLGQAVEDAMERSPLSDELFALVNDYELSGVNYETDGDGSSPIGKIQLDYNLNYTTTESRDPSLSKFKRMNTIYKANGQESDDAQEICDF